jgi:hypothetical protein
MMMMLLVVVGKGVLDGSLLFGTRLLERVARRTLDRFCDG